MSTISPPRTAEPEIATISLIISRESRYTRGHGLPQVNMLNLISPGPYHYFFTPTDRAWGGRQRHGPFRLASWAVSPGRMARRHYLPGSWEPILEPCRPGGRPCWLSRPLPLRRRTPLASRPRHVICTLRGLPRQHARQLADAARRRRSRCSLRQWAPALADVPSLST